MYDGRVRVDVRCRMSGLGCMCSVQDVRVRVDARYRNVRVRVDVGYRRSGLGLM